VRRHRQRRDHRQSAACAVVGQLFHPRIVGQEGSTFGRYHPSVSLFDFLTEMVLRVFGWWWLDNETQRADSTAIDLFVRFSVAMGVVAVLIWFWVRFLA